MHSPERNKPSSIAMSAAERIKGRYMRSPDDHAPSPAPAAEPAAPAEEESGFTGEEINEEIDSGDRQPPAPAEDDDKPSEKLGDGESGEGDEPEAKSSTQQRFDELTASRREAERDAEYWRAVAEGRISNPNQQPDGEEKPNAPPVESQEPSPDDYEYGETDSRYIKDLARYEARQEHELLRRQDEINTQITAVESGWAERQTAAKEKYDDYEEVVNKGADENRWSCSNIMTLGIKTSERGPDMAYHLAKNPEESRRIAGLSPLEQAKEIGRLEMRLEMETASAAEPDPAASTQQVTSAPPPPPRARGEGGKFAPKADTDDFEAFEKFADENIR